MNYNEITREAVEQATILRGLVGSTIHGTAISDGVDDRDEMGICVEPIHWAMGVGQPFEQYVYRTAVEREGHHDARSQAGDLDLTIYSLRKYVRLALKGNPTILLLLFTPPLTMNALGSQLRGFAPQILSRRAGGAFLGYLQAQRQRLLGERGQKGVRRQELEERYGFDTKFAMHMLRLGYQGIELLSSGKMTLPIEEPTRSWLVAVRSGLVPLQDCLSRAGELEREIRDLLESEHLCALPAEPDVQAVEQWMVEVYYRNWQATAADQDLKLSQHKMLGALQA